MANSSITTNVILNGSVGAGFTQLSDKLVTLGATVMGISQQISGWLKDSSDTYRDYETIMLEVHQAMKVAYKEAGMSTSDLKNDFAGLEAAVQKWASTSIFHVSDVSEAVLAATRAGWSYDQMLEGIPAAMALAQAGGMDLSTALGLLVPVLAASGTEFKDSTKLIDQWAYAANHAPTTIEEMGNAMTKMGATMQFADSNEELLALLGTLAIAGTTGEAAGTLLRNSMIRLVAPTDKAKKAMGGLKTSYQEIADLLGVTVDDVEGILADVSDNETYNGATLDEAQRMLEQVGFSAYDAKGRLKPMIQIYKELNQALNRTDAAGNKILTEEQQNDILSAIFPTRTITGAKNLLDNIGVLEGLYSDIQNGADEYASGMAEARTSGLYGKQEMLLSQWEEFKRKIGEIIAEPLGNAYEAANNFVSVLNNLPTDTLAALTGAATALAAAGPAMLIAGMGMKAFTLLGPYGTAAMVAAVGMGALAGYTEQVNKEFSENQFGSMELDVESLMKIIGETGTVFSEESESWGEFAEAVNDSASEYQSAANKFNESLLNKILLGGELTGADLDRLTELGKNMTTALLKGINQASSRDTNILRTLLGNGVDFEGEEQFAGDAEALLSYYYADLYAEAYQIGQSIHNRLTAGLGGELTDEDRAAIQAEIARLNEIQRLIMEGTEQEAFETQMYRAGKVSKETAGDFITQNAAKRDERLASIDSYYEGLAGRLGLAYQRALESGQTTIDYVNHAGEKVTRELPSSIDEIYAWIAAEQAAARKSESEKYNQPILRMMEALMGDSSYADLWNVAKKIYNDPNFGKGQLTDDTMAAIFSYAASGGKKLDSETNRWLGNLLKNPNTPEYLQTLYSIMSTGVDPLTGQYGNSGNANWIRGAGMSIQGLLNGNYKPLNYPDWYKQWLIQNQQSKVDQAESEYTDYLNNNTGWFGSWKKQGLQDALERERNALTELYQKLYGTEGPPVAPENPQLEVDVNLNTENATNWMGEPKDIDVNVGLVTGEAEEWFNTPRTIPVTVQPVGMDYTGGGKGGGGKGGGGGGGGLMTLFAEGGRANEASIFGEAGPEWAIPEEHSARTAALLNSAREASGFTWDELIDRTGGLNGTPQVSVTVASYAPTIYANDASGVEEQLLKDKKRLAGIVSDAVRRAMANNRIREEIEVYA